MAPVKSAKLAGPSQTSSSKAKSDGKQKPKHKVHRRDGNADANAVPGVQKIKSALRQTRRLLARDNLAADVRVNTERRLKSLEGQLVEAERSRKERVFAQRYHRIKFFERQKVTRKLNQVKRQLDSCTDKKTRKKLERSLKELRVDLNYVLYYPKLKKYVSLFPPEVRHGSKDAGESKGGHKEIGEESSTTGIQREEIRRDIRERMERGELSQEPELEHRRARVAKDRPDAIQISGAKSQNSSGPKRAAEIEEDDFFGEESDEHATGGEASEGESEDEDDRMDES